MHTLIQLFIKFDHTMWDRHKAYRSGKKFFLELWITHLVSSAISWHEYIFIINLGHLQAI